MNSLFEPKSIAIIGASNTPGKVGHDIVKNLSTQGYAGKIYPVNPKAEPICNLVTFTNIKNIPEHVELAIIVIPASAVPSAVQECIVKKVENIMIISAGFSEVHTAAGQTLEQEIVNLLKPTTINLVGPNCLGIVRPSMNMNASFATSIPPSGKIAFISQSGAMAVAIMDAASKENLGFSMVASIGNKTLLDECDWLEFCEQDDKTKVIAFYLEGIKDGPRFLKIAKRVTKTKPIVVLKSGVSGHGQKAASSHTGALAGNEAAINAACAQTGIHRANTSQELLELMQVLSIAPALLSTNIAIVTNAGGPGILATDAAENFKLNLPSFSKKTLQAVVPHLPAAAGLVNPMDVIGDADETRYKHAIEACALDPNIDGLCVIITPQVMTPCDAIAHIIVDASHRFPLMPIVGCFMGEESVKSARQILKNGSVASFNIPERAISALSALKKPEIEENVEENFVYNSQSKTSTNILHTEPAGLLTPAKTKEILTAYNLPIPAQGVATTINEAIRIASEITYPVIAKISSKDIIHKTDIGGVRANIKNEAELEESYELILKNVKKHAPTAEIEGIFIQKFLPVGHEFIIGAVRDAVFGPLIMVGLGGIYTELFKDTSFKIAPINSETSYKMLQELTAWKLLLGMRGAEQSDIDSICRIICHISTLMLSEPRITEIDINPILVGTKEVVLADVKIILS